jgi:hypothetical protein
MKERVMDPGMHVAYADRQRVIGLLQRLVVDGRLTLDEFAARTDAAYSAVTFGELAKLTTDLLTSPSDAPAAPRRQGGSDQVT